MATIEELLERWVDAWSNGREDGIADLLHPACRLSGIGGPIPVLSGPAAYLPFYRILRHGFPDARVEVHEVLSAPDGRRGAVRFTIHGTHRGDFLGVPETGRAVSAGGAAFVISDGARFVDMSTVWDLSQVLSGIGALPVPVPSPEQAAAIAAGLAPT